LRDKGSFVSSIPPLRLGALPYRRVPANLARARWLRFWLRFHVGMTARCGPTGRMGRSPRSSPSVGKPRTWRRGTASPQAGNWNIRSPSVNTEDDKLIPAHSSDDAEPSTSPSTLVHDDNVIDGGHSRIIRDRRSLARRLAGPQKSPALTWGCCSLTKWARSRPRRSTPCASRWMTDPAGNVAPEAVCQYPRQARNAPVAKF
jgi:hypothetical protein